MRRADLRYTHLRFADATKSIQCGSQFFQGCDLGQLHTAFRSHQDCHHNQLIAGSSAAIPVSASCQQLIGQLFRSSLCRRGRKQNLLIQASWMKGLALGQKILPNAVNMVLLTNL